MIPVLLFPNFGNGMLPLPNSVDALFFTSRVEGRSRERSSRFHNQRLTPLVRNWIGIPLISGWIPKPFMVYNHRFLDNIFLAVLTISHIFVFNFKYFPPLLLAQTVKCKTFDHDNPVGPRPYAACLWSNPRRSLRPPLQRHQSVCSSTLHRLWPGPS